MYQTTRPANTNCACANAIFPHSHSTWTGPAARRRRCIEGPPQLCVGRGADATRPVHPECPDASSGCIEGPPQLSAWGGADATRPVHTERPDASSGCIEGPAQLSVGRGADATRPVHPECPDASSGCIEGPAQLSVWGGDHTSIGDRVARPSSLNTLCCTDSTSVLLCPRAIPLSPHTHPASAVPPRNAARRFAPLCAVSDRADPARGVPSTGQACHPPNTNGTEWRSFQRKTRPAASAHSRGQPPHRVRPVVRPARAGTQSQRRRWNSTSSATDTAPLRTMTAANDQPRSSKGRSMFIP